MNKITLVITAIYASLCISSCSKKPQIIISLNGFTNDTIVIAQVPSLKMTEKLFLMRNLSCKQITEN